MTAAASSTRPSTPPPVPGVDPTAPSRAPSKLAAVAMRARRRLASAARDVPAALALAAGLAAIYLLAVAIRFDGRASIELWRASVANLPIVLGCQLSAFVLTRSLRGAWRDVRFAEVVRSSEAALLGGAAMLALWPFRPAAGAAIPASVVAIDGLCTVVLVAAGRGFARLVVERYAPMLRRRVPRRALLVGAGATSGPIIRSLRQHPGLGLEVVGVLDADPRACGRRLAGVEIVGTPGELGRHAESLAIDVVLASGPGLLAAEARALASDCLGVGLPLLRLPSIESLLRGELAVRPRDVDVHDLLRRDPVRIDDESIGHDLRGGVALVTGAAGSIGSEICRQVLRYRPRKLILLDHSENGLFYLERELRALAQDGTEVVPFLASITDGRRVRAAFDRHRPAVVFHAAAHKHVPMSESNPGEAVKNNVFGTRTVASEAIRAQARSFVLISTDKAVNPSSVMGATKRLAELYVRSRAGTSATRCVTVRFGNVLGSSGSVVPIFRDQIRAGGPVTVTHPEMTRYFMTIPEAARLVLQAGAMGRGGEVFVLEMGEPVVIADLARRLIELSGPVEGRDIEITYTGMRPGEKLHEELRTADEASEATAHPKVIRLRQEAGRPAPGPADFDRLARAVDEAPEAIVAILSELVEGYRPGRPAGRPAAVAGPMCQQAAGRPGTRSAGQVAPAGDRPGRRGRRDPLRGREADVLEGRGVVEVSVSGHEG